MRFTRTAAAVAVAIASTATSLVGVPAGAVGVPAGAASGTGTLAVSMLDDHGDPSRGILYLVRSDGTGTQLTKVTGFRGSVDTGSYGVMAFTVWGGIRCVALDPCSTAKVQKGEVIPDGSLVVTEGETTKVRIKASPPAKIAGTPRVGKVVRVKWSRPMAALVRLLTPSGAAPVVQWLRNGRLVRGTVGERYVVAAADVGARLAAKMTYPAIAAEALEQTVGKMTRSRTTPAVRVRR